MSAHYHISVFWSDEDGCWIADVPDLPGCSATAAARPRGRIELELIEARPIACECVLLRYRARDVA
jgi:hypothetical protein